MRFLSLITFLFFTYNLFALTYYSDAAGGDPNDVNNWWRNSNGNGQHPTNFTSGDIFVIQSGHNYTTTNAWNVTGTVQVDGTLTIQTANAISILTISNGGLVYGNAQTTIASTASGGQFNINAGGKYIFNHATANNATTLFNGAETFASSSTIEYQNFETTSGAYVSCLAASSSNYGNVIWNIQTGSESYNLNLSNTTARTVAVNFTITKTGNTGSLNWCNNSNVAKLTITGNFIQTAGIFNVINTGVGSHGAIFEVLGNFTLSGGTFDVGKSYSYSASTYLGGDVTISGGTFTNGGPNTSNIVYFTKSGSQTFTYTSGTFTTTSTPFVINSGSTVSLGSNFNIDLSLTVNSGGTLNIPNPYFTSGAGTTTISAGATLKTGHLDGISTLASTGCLQTTIKTCSTAATYEYNGVSRQFSGNINATNTAGNLIFNNAAGVRLNSNLIVANGGTLTLTQGYHNLNSYTLQLGTSASANSLSYIAGGLYSSTNDGAFTRYIPSATRITASSGNFYGLFPFSRSPNQVGLVKISTTANVTTGGFITIIPTFGIDNKVACNVSDGANTIVSVQEGSIFRISNCTVIGGTSISIEYNPGKFKNNGNINRYCLATYSSGVVSVLGSHSSANGTVQLPFVYRTSINNMFTLAGVPFILGTYNVDTPMDYICDLGGTKTVGPTGNYLDLTEAIDDIVSNGLSSSIILELQSTYVSTNESFPISLTQFACLNSSNTLTIRPASGATSLSISGSRNSANGLIDFNGGDYVTIDGRPGGTGTTSQLTITNTHSNSPVITFRNDANYNAIKYNLLKAGSTSSSEGAIYFRGTTGTGTTGNKYDTITNCSITYSPSNTLNNGICTDGESSEKLNNFNFIQNNNFIDFQRAAIYVSTNSDAWTISGNHIYQTSAITPTANVYGIQIATGSGYTLSGNYFGGQAVNCGGNPFVVNSSTNHLFPIYLSVGTTTTTSIQGNVIRNITFNTTSNASSNAGIFTGIYVTGAGSLNIGTVTGNIIGDTTASTSNDIGITSTNTGVLIQGIYTYATGNVSIQNNLIGDFNTSNVSGKGYLFNGIYTGNTSTTNISSNTIGSIGSANSITIGGSLTAAGVCEFYGIYQNASGAPTISSNTIANVSVFGTGASELYGIYNVSGAATNAISSNLIRNISMSSGTNTSARLVGVFSSAAAATNVTSNYIHTVTCGNGFFKGIYLNNASGNNTISLNVIGNGSVGNITISSTATCNPLTTDVVNNHSGIVLGTATNTSSLTSNVVKGISGTSSSFAYSIAGISIGNSTPIVSLTSNLVDIVGVSSNTSAASTVYGIYSGSTSISSVTNKKNIIRNLFCANTNAPTIIGWYDNALNRTYINNFIAVENTTGSTSYTVNSILYGMYLVNPSSGRTANFYYNTIELAASVSSNPVTATVYQASTTANTFVYRNNVFQNNCTSTGSLVFWGASSIPTCTMNHNFYMNYSAPGTSFAKVNNAGISSVTFNSASDDYGGTNSTYTTTALTINTDGSISPMATIYGGADLSAISGCTEDINGTTGNRNIASTNVYKGCYEGPVATYYWVGGAGNWSDFANHWAYSSGGAPIATAVPTTSIDVVFDFNSGVGQVNLAASSNCRKFTCSGFTGTIAGTSPFNVYDNFTTVSGMNWVHSGTLNLLATTVGKTIATGGIPIASNIVLNGVGAEYTLQDNTILNGSITLTNGSIVVGPNTLTLGSIVTPIRTNGYIKANGSNSTIKFENANTEVTIASGLFYEDSIRNLTMNGSGGIHLTSDLTITKCLTLTSGNIDIWANHLYIASTGFVTGYSAASYVQTESSGNLIQKGLGIGSPVGKTFFPIGQTINSYTPVNLVNDGTTDDFSVKIIRGHYANGTSGAVSTADKIDRTWFVEEATLGGSNVTMTIQWNTAEELPGFNRALCFISHYTNGVWDSYTTTPASGTNPWSLTRTEITSFSPFSPDEGSALPIRLSKFEAVKNRNQVNLNWITENEINNDFFTIERSVDGKEFFEIGRKKGAGNSSTTLYYSSIDERPLKGTSYYRLKQTDFDGKYAYSQIESVTMDEKTLINGLKIYPNPSEGYEVNVELSSESKQKVTCVLLNSVGQEKASDSFDVESGPTKFELNYSMFSAGLYILEISSTDGSMQHFQLKLGRE